MTQASDAVSVAIDVQNITRRYNGFRAVDNVSFQVHAGTIFGLLGPNGAGKSTIIKMLTTLLPPTSGTAEIFGLDIVKNPAKVRANIGYVSQLISADGDLTGYENLLLSAKLYGLDRITREQRIAEVLNYMGLVDVAHHLVRQYSGGMIRRLEIAQALLHHPNVLFLDEPSVGLDPSARQTVWRHLQDWRTWFKTTIFITTHDMIEADRLCDVVAFMYRGKVVAIDSPANFKAKIGPTATLDDVFLATTGTSIQEGGDYAQAKQTRSTISHLD